MNSTVKSLRLLMRFIKTHYIKDVRLSEVLEALYQPSIGTAIVEHIEWKRRREEDAL